MARHFIFSIIVCLNHNVGDKYMARSSNSKSLKGDLKRYSIVSMLTLIFLVTPILADDTVKTIKINGGFVENALQGEQYAKTFNFKSPDGYQKDYYVKATFLADNPNSQSTRFYVKLADEFCTPTYYEIPANAHRYQMDFDCTNNFIGEGNYLAGFQSNGNLNNVFGEWEITYMNQPTGDLDLWGTEYAVDQKGTVWLQLRDDNGQGVTDGSCHINIWKPNTPNETHPIWITDAPMLYLDDSDGLYFYDFIVPQEEGVYLMSAECSYVYDFEWYYDGVDSWSIRTVLEGSYQGDTVNLNSYEDYVYTECLTDGNPKRCEATYEFTLDNTTIENLDLFWSGSTDEDLSINFAVYNWTSSSYIDLPNSLISSGMGFNYPVGLDEMVTNTIPDLNNTISDTNKVLIYMNATDKSGWLFNNWLSLRASQEGDFLVDMRGSGEIHVSSGNVTGVSFVGQVGNVSHVDTVSFVESIDNDRLEYAGATEYISGTEGQLIYQYITIQAGNQVPINDADWCNVTIYYPNDTVYIDNLNMPYFSGTNGLYKGNFSVPYVDGVYKNDVVCYRSPKYSYASSTFHVENTLLNNQDYMKSKIDDIWDYVQEMINQIFGMVIS
jgi:hypothetical protein